MVLQIANYHNSISPASTATFSHITNAPASPPCSGLDSNYTIYSTDNGEKFAFRFYDTIVQRNAAKSICENDGLSLAKFKSFSETEAFFGFLDSNTNPQMESVWVALENSNSVKCNNRYSCFNKLYWPDGTKFLSYNFPSTWQICASSRELYFAATKNAKEILDYPDNQMHQVLCQIEC